MKIVRANSNENVTALSHYEFGRSCKSQDKQQSAIVLISIQVIVSYGRLCKQAVYYIVLILIENIKHVTKYKHEWKTSRKEMLKLKHHI